MTTRSASDRIASDRELVANNAEYTFVQSISPAAITRMLAVIEAAANAEWLISDHPEGFALHKALAAYANGGS